MPYVEGDDAGGSALQEDVGEAASRCPDVETLPAVHGDPERVEGVGELEAAAADVGVIRNQQLDVGVALDRRSGLGDGPAGDQDLARQDQRPRPLAGGRQAAFAHDLVQSRPRCASHRSSLAAASRFPEEAPTAPLSLMNPVPALEDVLERERLARLDAERIADETIRDLYERQCEMQMLRSVAFAANDARSIEGAVRAAVESVCRYARWAVAHVFFVTEDERFVSSDIWYDEAGRFADLRAQTDATTFGRGHGLPGHVLAQELP